MPRLSLFFLHCPKAGGTSLRRFFARHFAPEAVAPEFGIGPNDYHDNVGSIGKLHGYRFYAGHYGYEMFKRYGDEHLLTTNFRDPVERIVSLYRYWRNIERSQFIHLNPGDAAIALLAHEHDFSGFIRSDHLGLGLYLNNFHSRQLHRSPWEIYELRPWHMLQVKRRILHMRWFYVTELPKVSELLLDYAIPELSPVEFPIDNKTGGEKLALSKSDAEHLTRLNSFDYEIFRYALQLQLTRLRRRVTGPQRRSKQ